MGAKHPEEHSLSHVFAAVWRLVALKALACICFTEACNTSLMWECIHRNRLHQNLFNVSSLSASPNPVSQLFKSESF